jgi:hypothetical protein
MQKSEIELVQYIIMWSNTAKLHAVVDNALCFLTSLVLLDAIVNRLIPVFPWGMTSIIRPLVSVAHSRRLRHRSTPGPLSHTACCTLQAGSKPWGAVLRPQPACAPVWSGRARPGPYRPAPVSLLAVPSPAMRKGPLYTMGTAHSHEISGLGRNRNGDTGIVL